MLLRSIAVVLGHVSGQCVGMVRGQLWETRGVTGVRYSFTGVRSAVVRGWCMGLVRVTGARD